MNIKKNIVALNIPNKQLHVQTLTALEEEMDLDSLSKTKQKLKHRQMDNFGSGKGTTLGRPPELSECYMAWGAAIQLDIFIKTISIVIRQIRFYNLIWEWFVGLQVSALQHFIRLEVGRCTALTPLLDLNYLEWACFFKKEFIDFIKFK